MDDAGVVRLGGGEGLPAGLALALVQTVDFFPPVVDDPTAYGAIAAANSVSDVYAMGGRPFSAVCLASFPRDLRDDWIAAIFEGALAKMREAGTVIAGGHTVDGAVQFGFAVTGLIDPERVVTNSGARPGDRLYLTKPLGTGCMTTAAKKRAITAEELAPAAAQMAALNRDACEAMLAAGASACTDVTGFGLAGHGRNVGAASGVTLCVETARLPLLPGVLELGRRGLFSGGARRGREGLGDQVRVGPGVDEALAGLCYDAETSGGLLIAVPAARAERLEGELARRGVLVAPIGACAEARGPAVELL